MKEKRQSEPAEKEYSMRQTLEAFQDILVSMKLKRMSPKTPLDMASAFGGEDDMLKHLINLQEAVKYLQKAPKDRLKTLSDVPALGSVKDGTTPFRIQHRLLEPAIENRTTTVTMDQLEEAVLVLHAYNRLNG